MQDFVMARVRDSSSVKVCDQAADKNRRGKAKRQLHADGNGHQVRSEFSPGRF